MNLLFLNTSPPTSLLLRPSRLPSFKPLYKYHYSGKFDKRKLRNGKFKAEFSADAPISVAIGACILNSLVFPVAPSPEEDEGDSLIDSADARFAVMGIISLLPYFNWMSWVFAWLDTGKRRYAVYAIVYLAPYLRSNLSLSPEESWLPIASILLCIAHIQIEASIKNGDLQGLQLFKQASNERSSITVRKDGGTPEKERTKGHKNLPSVQEESRDELQRWKVSRKQPQDPEYSDEDGKTNGGSRH